MTPVLMNVYAFLFGACWGSFLNVCIARWPAEMSVVRPASRCPHCERPIRWYENIPIVGWLMLRGRCAGCQQRISIQYPLIELTVALGWLVAVLVFDDLFTALRVAVFGTIMLGIAVTDAKHYLIPDGFTVFGLIWVLLTAMAATMMGSVSPFAGLFAAIVGACTGAGAIAIAKWLGEVAMKKEAMGFGDVTLMAVSGAALGPPRTLLTVFLAAFIGAVTFLGIVYPIAWIRSSQAGKTFEPPLVPFGVFLAPASLIALLWGNQLIDWYLATLPYR